MTELLRKNVAPGELSEANFFHRIAVTDSIKPPVVSPLTDINTFDF